MSETCPTVKIKTAPTEENPEGVVIINQADFDPDVHELVDPPAKKKPAKKDGE